MRQTHSRIHRMIPGQPTQVTERENARIQTKERHIMTRFNAIADATTLNLDMYTIADIAIECFVNSVRLIAYFIPHPHHPLNL